MKLVCRSLIAVFFVALGAGEAIAKGNHFHKYSDIFYFGDSLTDTGNVWLLTGFAVPPAEEGYFDGRFSNGPVWSDRLSRLNDAESSATGGNNYAYGGARTSYHPSTLPISVADQIQMYLGDIGAAGADPEALYVVWGGANDVQDAVAIMDDPQSAETLVVEGARNIAGFVQQLRAAGAVHILVPNSPNVGLTPRWSEREEDAPGTIDFATNVSKLFNDTLDAELDALEFEVMRFNTYALFEVLVRFPELLGFSNSTDRCYTGDDISWTGGGEICSNPEEYVWWDGVHPTTKVHEVVAKAARLKLRLKNRPRARIWGKMIGQ